MTPTEPLLPSCARKIVVMVRSRINPIETPEHANKFSDINHLQRMTQFNDVLRLVRKFSRATFLSVSPLFSTVFDFGIKIAPLARVVPNNKCLRINHLERFPAFDG
jgi:hypothetical protein